MNTTNFEVLEQGTLHDVLIAAAYTIHEIYLSYMGRFECADIEAEKFLSRCLLDNILKTEPTMSAIDYDQSVYGYLSEDYIILTDDNQYYLCIRDEYEEEESLHEYRIKKEDYETIFKEIRKEVEQDFKTEQL